LNDMRIWPLTTKTLSHKDTKRAGEVNHFDTSSSVTADVGLCERLPSPYFVMKICCYKQSGGMIYNRVAMQQ